MAEAPAVEPLEQPAEAETQQQQQQDPPEVPVVPAAVSPPAVLAAPEAPATPVAAAVMMTPAADQTQTPAAVAPRAYRPTFMQQHVKSMSVASPPPFSHSAQHSYQGIRPNVGSDTFMMQHTKSTSPTAGVSTRLGYQGVKPHVGSDMFVSAELRKAQDNMTAATKKRELKPHIGSDSLFNDFARRQQEQSGHAKQFNPLGGAQAVSKPHIGPDSMMTDFAKKQQASQRQPLNLMGGDKPKPHITGDAFVAAQLRVTKAQVCACMIQLLQTTTEPPSKDLSLCPCP